VAFPTVTPIDPSDYQIAYGMTTEFITRINGWMVANTNWGDEINAIGSAMEEWVLNPEDVPISVEAGGDGSTTFSIIHQWAKATAEIAADKSDALTAIGAAGDDELAAITVEGAARYDAITLAGSDAVDAIEAAEATALANISTWDPENYYTAVEVDGLFSAFTVDWSAVSGKPTFATVATSGAYSDLSGAPSYGTGVLTFLATPSSANLRAALTDEVGTGAAYFVGGALGTPASGNLGNCTAYPIASVANLAAGIATFLTTPTSANLRAALTDETGTGVAYFVGGNLGTPSGGDLSNCSGVTVAIGSVTGAGDLASRNRATAAQIRAMSADVGLTCDRIASALGLVSIAGTANWTPDWSAFLVADFGGITANRTINNPTNVVVGTTRYAFVRGSSGTARTLTFGSNFKGDIPSLTDITTSKWYLLTMVAYSSTHIVISSVRAL
jgi:hypothetical protein